MSTGSCFDVAQLLRSCGDDETLAHQVTVAFLCDTPGLLDGLEQSVAAGDAKTAVRFSHSIKGTSAAVGGEILRASAYECERLARAGELDEAGERIAGLRRHFLALRAAIIEHGYGQETL